MHSAIYDRLGTGYSATRRPDPRIARQIEAALGDSGSVVNVGAGAGSYEPADRTVIAVEPSATMVAQRGASCAPAIRGVAGALPLRDRSFDASLAILTMHHWPDWRAGMAEMARVARRRIVMLTFTWDDGADQFWLLDYLPEVLEYDRPRFPSTSDLGAAVGWDFAVSPVAIPSDCIDGFLGSWWARPEAYLDPAVRRGISTLAQINPEAVQRGVARLGDDLSSGTWEQRYGSLRQQTEIDLGYRLVVWRR